jgi:hypothetical protein
MCSMENETTDSQISDSAIYELARNYSTLLQTLRGGHHPYMEHYNSYLKSLRLMGPDDENHA